MLHKLFDIFDITYRTDGIIGNKIYAELKAFDKSNSKAKFDERQDYVHKMLLNIYGNKSHSIDDIFARKIYLETKLDNNNQIASTLVLGVFTWALCDFFAGAITIFSDDITKYTNLFITTIIPAVFLIPTFTILAKLLCRQDTLYRKYNLCEQELQIINKIISKRYNYDEFTSGVVNLYFNGDSDK